MTLPVPPWLLAALPLLGAAVGALFWEKLTALKSWTVFVAGATLAALGTLAWAGAPAPRVGWPLAGLLPLAALLTLLGQPVHRENREACLLSLLMLGLGLGTVTAGHGRGPWFLIALFGVLASAIRRFQQDRELARWLGLGTFALGIACLGMVLIAAPLASVAWLIAAAMLIPLVPFHTGYLALLTGLPGNLPAFLAVLLPTLGLHVLYGMPEGVPEGAAPALMALSLLGALYGSFQALVQVRVRQLVAYGSLAFFSIFWWHVSAAHGAGGAAVYLQAVALATSGLLMAWYAIRVRHGRLDLYAISGLARPMPRFTVVLVLLTLAAMGLPPFGGFAGLLNMLLATPAAFTAGVAIILFTWLLASWYYLGLMQGLLFGQFRPELRHQDLGHAELAALLGVVLLLLVLGLQPSWLLPSQATVETAGVGLGIWQK